MDKIKLLINLFAVLIVLIIIVDGINCDSQCDCTAIIDELGFIKTKLTQIEFDNYKIKSRLRRLEASKLHSTRPNVGIASKESDRQTTHDDKKEQTRDNDRIDSMETKLAGIESLLKIGDINGTDVQHGTVLDKMETNLSSVSIVLDRIETKLTSVSKQVNDTIAKNDAKKAVPGNVVRKTLLAEKRNRVKFETAVNNSLKDIKTSFNEFKRESVKMIANHSDTIDRKLEQSKEIVNEVSENIDKMINEEINAINGSLNDLTKELFDTKTGLSSLREDTVNNKKEFNVAFTAHFLHRNSTSHSTIVFRLTYINNGNAYDTRTGKFTCKIPGVYYFSVTLTKYYMTLPKVYTYLRINGVNKLSIYWKPYDHDDKHQYEQTPLTQSGTFHLNKNDVVDIYGIPVYFHNRYYSTFTGYLITPD